MSDADSDSLFVSPAARGAKIVTPLSSVPRDSARSTTRRRGKSKGKVNEGDSEQDVSMEDREDDKDKDGRELMSQMYSNGTLLKRKCDSASSSSSGSQSRSQSASIDEDEESDDDIPEHEPKTEIWNVGTEVIKELQTQLRELRKDQTSSLLKIEKVKDKLFVEWVCTSLFLDEKGNWIIKLHCFMRREII